jgi:hypothetical protein
MPQSAPIQWQKSSFSGAGGENCVELARAKTRLLLRESDAPEDVLNMAPQGLLGLIRHYRSKHQ